LVGLTQKQLQVIGADVVDWSACNSLLQLWCQ